jgi:PTH1 family peptidyl-tRNA hydrolase
MIIDHIARQNQVTIKEKLCDALVGEWSNHGESVVLVKPQTYMNHSGESVGALLSHFGSAPEDLIVVYDDLDLPFGRIRIRPAGGAGGHRGVLSIAESLAGGQFYRVRVGIGRPPDGVDAVDFVLEDFASPEVGQLNELISRASDAVVSLLREGGRRAMEQYNRAP